MSGSGYNKEFFENDIVSLVTSGYSIINMADAYVNDELFIGNHLTNSTQNNLSTLNIDGTILLNDNITIGGHLLSNNFSDIGIQNNKWKDCWVSSPSITIGNTVIIQTNGNFNISGGAIINNKLSFNHSITTTQASTIGNITIPSQHITSGTTLTGNVKTSGVINLNNIRLNGKTNYVVTGGPAVSFILVYNNNKCRLLGTGTNAGVFLNLQNSIFPFGYTRFTNIPLTSQLKNKILVDLDMGWLYVNAIDRDGNLYTWGNYGDNRDTGIGGVGSSSGGGSIPVNITQISNSSLYNKKIVQCDFCTFFNAIALDSDGEIHTWGNNESAQCGVGYTSGPIYMPVNISTIGSLAGNKFVKVANGETYCTALDDKGRLHAWGDRNSDRVQRLNIGTTSGTLLPMIVSTTGSLNDSFIKDIKANVNVFLCIDSEDRLHGFGPSVSNTATIRTGSLANKIPVKMASGRNCLFILDSDGELHGIGANTFNMLGPTGGNINTPVNISGISGSSLINKKVIAFGAGREHVLSIDQNGNLHVIGATELNTNRGQLGDGGITTGYTVPTQIKVNTQLDFTGQHKCYLNTENISTENLSGLIVVAKSNEYLNDSVSINEALPTVTLSTNAYDKTVFGVISNKYVEQDITKLLDLDQPIINEYITDNYVYNINSVGEGAIWITDQNGPIESGDYITTSSVPGYGMRQNDIKMCNYTVAKSTMDCDFEPQLLDIKTLDLTSLNWNDTFKDHDYERDSDGNVIYDTLGYAKRIDFSTPIKQQSFQYKMKYINSQGQEITQQEYTNSLSNNIPVYRAAFIGCTYHCG